MKLKIVFDYYTVARFDLRYFTRYFNLLTFNNLFYQFLWENEFFYRFEALNYNYVYNPFFYNYFICFDFVLRFNIQSNIADYMEFYPYSVYRALSHKKDYLFSFLPSYAGSLINIKSDFYNNIKLGHFLTNNDYFPLTYAHSLYKNLFNINFELSDLTIEFNFYHNLFSRKKQAAPYSVDVSISSFYYYWSSIDNPTSFGFRSRGSFSRNNFILVNTFLPTYCYHINHHFDPSYFKSTWLYFYFYFYQYNRSAGLFFASYLIKAASSLNIVILSPLINFINIHFNYTFINLFFYKFIFLYYYLIFSLNFIKLNFFNIFLKINALKFLFNNTLNKFESFSLIFSLFLFKNFIYLQPFSFNLNLIKNIYYFDNTVDNSIFLKNNNLNKNKFNKKFINFFFFTKFKFNYYFNIKSLFTLSYLDSFNDSPKLYYEISKKLILKDIPKNVYPNISRNSLILSKISYIYIKSLSNLNLFFKKFKFISFIIRLSFSKIFLKSSFLMNNKFKLVIDFIFIYFKLFYFFSLSYININFLKYNKYVLKKQNLFNNFYFLFNLFFIKLKLIFYISLNNIYKSFIFSRNFKSPFNYFLLRYNNSKNFLNELHSVNIYLGIFLINHYILKLIFLNIKQQTLYKNLLINLNFKKLFYLYLNKVFHLYEEQIFNLNNKTFFYLYKNIIKLLYGKIANSLFFKKFENINIMFLNDLKRSCSYFISLVDHVDLKNKSVLSFRLIFLLLKTLFKKSINLNNILKIKLAIFSILKELFFSFSSFNYCLLYLKCILSLIILIFFNNKKIKRKSFFNKFPNYIIFFEHPILNFHKFLDFIKNFLDNTFFNSFNFINNFFIQKINIKLINKLKKKFINKIYYKNINKFPIFLNKFKTNFNPLNKKVRINFKKIINISISLFYFNSLVITLINKFLFEVDYLSFLIFNDTRFSFLFLGYNTYLNFFNKKFKYFLNFKTYIKIFCFDIFELFYIRKHISVFFKFFFKVYFFLAWILKKNLNFLFNFIFNYKSFFFSSFNFTFNIYKDLRENIYNLNIKKWYFKNFYILTKPYFLKNPLSIDLLKNSIESFKHYKLSNVKTLNKKYKLIIGRTPFLYINLLKSSFLYQYWFKLLFSYVQNPFYTTFYKSQLNFFKNFFLFNVSNSFLKKKFKTRFLHKKILLSNVSNYLFIKIYCGFVLKFFLFINYYGFSK